MSTETTQGQLIDKVIKIRRCAAVVKGGRRFSFTAHGGRRRRPGKSRLGIRQGQRSPAGRGKSRQGRLPELGFHPHGWDHASRTWFRGNFGAASVILLPAGPGTGVIAGSSVRAVCEACGIRDILTKSFGSTNPINLVKATIDALNNCAPKRSRAAAGSFAYMNLNEVHKDIQKNKSKKRIGRGPGSGHGKTSTRGSKGQGSRSGYSSLRVFEGGQMPLVRRIPKRGFHQQFRRIPWLSINVGDLDEKFQSGEDVTPETIKAKSLIKGAYDILKVLGDGELTQKPEDIGAPIQPFGFGEDRKGRRYGRRSARQGSRG